MADLKKIGDILVLIGAIVGIVQGIWLILGNDAFGTNILLGVLGAAMGVVIGILGILFSVIALVNSGFIKISALNFGKKNKFLVVLIIGILMVLFASDFGGILVIIGAILWVL